MSYVTDALAAGISQEAIDRFLSENPGDEARLLSALLGDFTGIPGYRDDPVPTGGINTSDQYVQTALAWGIPLAEIERFLAANPGDEARIWQALAPNWVYGDQNWAQLGMYETQAPTPTPPIAVPLPQPVPGPMGTVMSASSYTTTGGSTGSSTTMLPSNPGPNEYVAAALAAGIPQSAIDAFLASNPGDYGRILTALGADQYIDPGLPVVSPGGSDEVLYPGGSQYFDESTGTYRYPTIGSIDRSGFDPTTGLAWRQIATTGATGASSIASEVAAFLANNPGDYARLPSALGYTAEQLAPYMPTTTGVRLPVNPTMTPRVSPMMLLAIGAVVLFVVLRKS